jgi:ketosteroid isomerase-like protein
MTVTIDRDKPDLTGDPDTQNDIFLEVFNSGDGDLFDRLYRDDAISNFSGAPLTGQERRKFFVDFVGAKPKLEAKVLYSYVAGDVALIAVDFRVEGVGPDGEPTVIAGKCTDVLRRVEDGRWLMAIDRPVVSGGLVGE